jgi:hypothetical protein
MSNGRETVVLYSGGTDSTLVALKMAEEFDRVHLLTFRRFGMFDIDHSEMNFQKLVERFGPEKFVRVRPYPRVDKLFRHLTYERYWRNLFRHGFFNLTTCGICKLSMHLRTLVYCHRHGVDHLCDGANQGMSIFPAQMERVLARMRALYAKYGVEYANPVYDYEDSQGLSFGSRLYGTNKSRPDPVALGMKTAGVELFEKGMLPAPDVKGTPYDRKMQARCYQFALFNVFARWYYFQKHTYAEYVERVDRLYSEKIDLCDRLLEEYVRSPEGSRLSALLEDLYEAA